MVTVLFYSPQNPNFHVLRIARESSSRKSRVENQVAALFVPTGLRVHCESGFGTFTLAPLAFIVEEHFHGANNFQEISHQVKPGNTFCPLTNMGLVIFKLLTNGVPLCLSYLFSNVWSTLAPQCAAVAMIITSGVLMFRGSSI